MTSNKWVLLVCGALLTATAMQLARADAGRELLVSGPVEQFDRGAGTVTVLGQKFKVAADQLSIGQVVNVYGQLATDGSITDTVVQSTGRFGTNGDTVFVKGIVTSNDPALGHVQVNGMTIDYTAELAKTDFTMPAVGDVIAVAGTEPAVKGVLVASGTGLAAYAVNESSASSGFSAPAGVSASESTALGVTDSSAVAGMTGSGHAGMTGSGHAGMTGSGHAGMTGSGHAGMTGSGHAGMTGSGHAGMTGSGHAGMTGSGHAGMTGSGHAGMTGSGHAGMTGSGHAGMTGSGHP